ncbi:CHAT domain-containing protein [Nostoc sphaeroides]|uniref:CHAT domain-containing protein n=1 Tax=Nostoc sphaeroides CCNUC1 TaxID=2653204 RepID=A0A5P8WH55_9NOSO|nr:CHAT domain-containing protein [Nostoc sphaeroides]QFS51931.1 CHAT domain-containing protein [Nostoc sphaeroides CCNUC1]
MNILHLDLKRSGDNYAEFRFFSNNTNDFKSRQLPLAQIEGLIKQAERDYYTVSPTDYAKTGQALYNWLDGSDRGFEQAIEHNREGIVLAITATERLAHLPWELLHDGQKFLVERRPAIIPVRWKADRGKLTWDYQPKNRALNVLFMASSPIDSDLPELDFEAEEGRILNATKPIPLSLTVEESGYLNELGYLVKRYPQGHFDVFHLTGHATNKNEKPCFITETELGYSKYSSAEDIADALQFKMPKLIFLSGCQTGYSWNKGIVPSMAEALLMEGATAVLSWGKKVSDTDATAAAATLYENLSAGITVTEAVAKTYQELIRNKVQDWHFLRLYVAEILPGALVTPELTEDRQLVPRPSVATEFLDSKGEVRVPKRENFIGRRRQLQNCLRSLKAPSEKIGALIHSMGGLGKSSIASRLCDRLSEHKKIVWWRQIDESSLVNELGASQMCKFIFIRDFGLEQ